MSEYHGPLGDDYWSLSGREFEVLVQGLLSKDTRLRLAFRTEHGAEG